MGFIVHILGCDMEVVQKFNEHLHSYPLESLVTDELDGAYGESPQSWGEWNQVVKKDEVLCTEAKQCMCRLTVPTFCSPSVKKIRNYFAFPTPENYTNQLSVMFSVSNRGYDIPALEIKVTETNFQTDGEKSLPIPETLAVLAYHGAPVIRNLRQALWTVFQLDQVAQHVQDEFPLSVGAIDCRGDRFG